MSDIDSIWRSWKKVRNPHNCCREVDSVVKSGIWPVKLLDEKSKILMFGAKLSSVILPLSWLLLTFLQNISQHLLYTLTVHSTLQLRSVSYTYYITSNAETNANISKRLPWERSTLEVCNWHIVKVLHHLPSGIKDYLDLSSIVVVKCHNY